MYQPLSARNSPVEKNRQKNPYTLEAFILLGKHRCSHINQLIYKVISEAKGYEETDQWKWLGWGWGATLVRMDEEGLFAEVTFELRPKWSQIISWREKQVQRSWDRNAWQLSTVSRGQGGPRLGQRAWQRLEHIGLADEGESLTFGRF